MRRRRGPSRAQALTFSLLLHGAFVALAWMSTLVEHEVVEFITYEVELVSPAPALQAEIPTPAAEDLVVEKIGRAHV